MSRTAALTVAHCGCKAQLDRSFVRYIRCPLHSHIREQAHIGSCNNGMHKLHLTAIVSCRQKGRVNSFRKMATPLAPGNGLPFAGHPHATANSKARCVAIILKLLNLPSLHFAAHGSHTTVCATMLCSVDRCVICRACDSGCNACSHHFLGGVYCANGCE